jgi:hypothetical protein
MLLKLVEFLSADYFRCEICFAITTQRTSENLVLLFMTCLLSQAGFLQPDYSLNSMATSLPVSIILLKVKHPLSIHRLQ